MTCACTAKAGLHVDIYLGRGQLDRRLEIKISSFGAQVFCLASRLPAGTVDLQA